MSETDPLQAAAMNSQQFDAYAGPELANDLSRAETIDQEALDRAADQLRRDEQIADAKRVKEQFELRVRGVADNAGDQWLYDHPLLVCKQCNTVVRPGWITVRTPTAFWVCGMCYLETDWSAYRHGPRGRDRTDEQRQAENQRYDDLFRTVFEQLKAGAGAHRRYNSEFNFGQYETPGSAGRARSERTSVKSEKPGYWVAIVVDALPQKSRRQVINTLLKLYHPDVSSDDDAEAVTRELLAALKENK